MSPGKLFPKFNASLTSYSVTVASSVSELKLTLLASDSGASYRIKVGSCLKSQKIITAHLNSLDVMLNCQIITANYSIPCLLSPRALLKVTRF